MDNIVYIDQMAKSAATGNQITFSLRDGDADGKYKVLMGGTGVAVAGNSEFTVGGGTATGVKVSGTTLAITVGDPYVNEVTNNAATYDISLRKADDMSTVLYQMAVNEETGEYSIENVVAGDYIMVMSRPGFLTRYCNVTVEATDVTVAYKELVLGDLDDSHDVVSTADNDAIAGAVQNGDINVYEVAEAYPVQYDFDVDGNIGTADVDTQAAVIAAGDISAFDAYTDADDNSDYYYGG